MTYGLLPKCFIKALCPGSRSGSRAYEDFLVQYSKHLMYWAMGMLKTKLQSTNNWGSCWPPEQCRS